MIPCKSCGEAISILIPRSKFLSPDRARTACAKTRRLSMFKTQTKMVLGVILEAILRIWRLGILIWAWAWAWAWVWAWAWAFGLGLGLGRGLGLGLGLGPGLGLGLPNSEECLSFLFVFLYHSFHNLLQSHA